jgi:hypothetical protein
MHNVTYCITTTYLVDIITPSNPTPYLKPVANLLHHHCEPQHLQLGF